MSSKKAEVTLFQYTSSKKPKVTKHLVSIHVFYGSDQWNLMIYSYKARYKDITELTAFSVLMKSQTWPTEPRTAPAAK